MARLARREHSAAELGRSLRRAGHSTAAVADALRRLGAQGALDDGRFAAGFARSRLQHHGLGRHRIRAALRQRGVAAETAERGLAEALRERPEREALEAAAARLLRQHARDEPRRRVARVFLALLRRGFPAALVRERLAAREPGCRDMLDEYGVAALGDDPLEPEPD